MSFAWTETELRKHGLKTDAELAADLRGISALLRGVVKHQAPAVRDRAAIMAEIEERAVVQKAGHAVTKAVAVKEYLATREGAARYDEYLAAPFVAPARKAEALVSDAESDRIAEIDRVLAEGAARWKERHAGVTDAQAMRDFLSHDRRAGELYEEQNRLRDRIMRRRG